VPPDRPAAGKTGTSEGGRDLWFIGGVPQLVTGLWLGYDNNKETKSTSAVAVVAWADYMAPILKDLPVRQFPPKPVLAGKFDPLKALKPKPKADPTAPVGGWQPSPTTEPAGAGPVGPPAGVVPEGTPSTPAPAPPGPVGAPRPSAPPPLTAPPAPIGPPPLP
jgi:penicillin-binding protein 1A